MNTKTKNMLPTFITTMCITTVAFVAGYFYHTMTYKPEVTRMCVPEVVRMCVAK